LKQVRILNSLQRPVDKRFSGYVWPDVALRRALHIFFTLSFFWFSLVSYIQVVGHIDNISLACGGSF